ncbi:MAG: aldehyde dehydrogenase (NADP(+)) [Pirellulales bacterium]
MTLQPVLIAGQWRAAHSTGTFRAENPATEQPLDDAYPISAWADVDAALSAASAAATELGTTGPERIATFLERYANGIETAAERLVARAHAETALPVKPRLAEVELPRTTAQLRAAARAAREGSWLLPTIDTKLNIRSCHAPLGPVWVFGPNNFPFAFNSISGGDFAAAIATGNPVIGKANSSHPGTTRLLGEIAHEAATAAELPAGSVQLIYRTSHADGERAVADPRTAATGYTGSRSAGLALKDAADRAGKPIYLELSSINPVLILPAAIGARGAEIAAEFAGSCLMGSGQFCTNPGFVMLLAGAASEVFLADVAERFRAARPGTLLSRGVATSLAANVRRLVDAGARVVCGGTPGGGDGYSFANTLLTVRGDKFLANAEAFQTEAFGNASLVVLADGADEAERVVQALEGNLTGTIYSDVGGADDALVERLSPALRRKVGRLLNDKMPTGVAVSPAMNHGGPYPATGHPGFTAVGIPAALSRFTALECYDNVRASRLPAALRDQNPTGTMWRLIDGAWTQGNVAG